MKVYVPVWNMGVMNCAEIETEKARFFPSHSGYGDTIEYRGTFYNGNNVYRSDKGVRYYWSGYNLEEDRIDPVTLKWSNCKPR